MTKCPKCKFYSICGGRLNETVENCVRFKSVEQTNEEWFCTLSTEEKAKEMCVIMADMAEANDGVWDEEMIEAWLKEKHK